MKKVIISACAIFAALTLSFAQDINEATDLYNNAATSLSMGDKTGAMDSFQKAYALAKECGEAGEELVANCESIIPSLALSIAKDDLRANNYDAAIAQLEAAAKIAEELNNEDIALEATALIPQTLMQKGNSLLKTKEYEAAAEAYQAVLAINPNNGKAAIYLGQAYDKAGQTDKAEEAYLLAAANGQEKAANKQLASIYLKKASAANQAKKYDEAIKLAEKCNSYMETSKAYYVAGRAAQSSEKIALAIKYYEKYLELEPSANNAQDIRTVVEALKKAQAGK